MTLLDQPKLLTCILPAGLATDLVATLQQEQNICSAHVHRGRGASQRSGSFADEVDILTVAVPGDRCDAIFEFLHEHAQIGEKPHRFLYQGPLDATTLFTLPDVAPDSEG